MASGVSTTWSPADHCPVFYHMAGKDPVGTETKAMEFGRDDYGMDVTFRGATSGAYMMWDESADKTEYRGAYFRMGTLSSTTTTAGTKVDATTTRVMEVHASDHDTARATGTTNRAILARTMIFANSSSEDWGIHGLSKMSGVAKTANVSAGVVGAFESTGTCSTATGSGNTFVAGVMGRLGGGGTFTIGTSTYACGVLSFYNTSTTNAFTNTGTIAYMATASDIAGTGNWDYGLYVEDTVRAGYFSTELSGSTALNNIEFAVADATTNSSGYTRGVYVNATVSGTKTSSGEFNGIGVDATVSGDTPYVYGYTFWSQDSGNPTISLVAPISIYQDDMGSAVSSWLGMDIGYAFTNDMASQFACIRMRNHSSTIKPESMILGQCNNNYHVADYFVDFQGSPQGPIVADTSALPGNATYKIKCRYQSTDFYLIGVADF